MHYYEKASYFVVKHKNSGVVHIDHPDIGSSGDFSICGVYGHSGKWEDLGPLSNFDYSVITCKRCNAILKTAGVRQF